MKNNLIFSCSCESIHSEESLKGNRLTQEPVDWLTRRNALLFSRSPSSSCSSPAWSLHTDTSTPAATPRNLYTRRYTPACPQLKAEPKLSAVFNPLSGPERKRIHSSASVLLSGSQCVRFCYGYTHTHTAPPSDTVGKLLLMFFFILIIFWSFNENNLHINITDSTLSSLM